MKSVDQGQLAMAAPGLKSFERRTEAVLFGLAISAANLPSALFKVFLTWTMLNGSHVPGSRLCNLALGTCRIQLLDGGAPVQLTHLDSESAALFAYARSRGSEKFAITGAHYNDIDVVLFSGFKQNSCGPTRSAVSWVMRGIIR